MAEKQKILVCGGVKGKFKTLFQRVNAISEKSGPFEMVLCVGDFFGDSPASWEPYRAGMLKVPVPTYILGPSRPEHEAFYPDPNGGELCNNINYLGRRGILTSCGLKIAYVSGSESTRGDKCHFDDKDVLAVRDIALKCQNFIGIDVLVSSQWPRGVKEGEEGGSEHLAWLACQLKPRYHFTATSNVFYERPPYVNHEVTEDGSTHATRFITLAEVGNAGKQKWMFAASLTPIDKMKKKELHQATSDQTECPYPKLFAQFNRTSQREPGKQFFYDMSAPQDDRIDKRKRREDGEARKKMTFDPDSCWFCLASPAVQKHLVVSVGEEVYLALARGGLTDLHVMVLPIQHHQSMVVLSDSVRKEIKKFKSSLRKFFKTKGLVPVYFERNYRTSHLQLQVVPVGKNSPVKEAFHEGAEDHGLELSEMPEHSKLEDIVEPGTPYFYVELPSKERLFCSCKKNFPIMFGRDVLAGESILNLPHKVDWKDCTLSKEEEQAIVGKFRDGFKQFDFTN